MAGQGKQGEAPEGTDEFPVAHLDGEFAGRWVQYRRSLTGREFIAFMRAPDDPAGAFEAMAGRVVKHNFPTDILDQDMKVGWAIINAFNKREEKQALDPKSGGA